MWRVRVRFGCLGRGFLPSACFLLPEEATQPPGVRGGGWSLERGDSQAQSCVEGRWELRCPWCESLRGRRGEALEKATGGHSASPLPRQKLSQQRCCVVGGMDSAPA